MEVKKNTLASILLYLPLDAVKVYSSLMVVNCNDLSENNLPISEFIKDRLMYSY